MKTITCISDTHGSHEELTPDLPGGWMIIHAGDVCENIIGGYNFINWFSKLPYEHKIFIAGNHDFCFEKDRMPINNNVHYLQDNFVSIENIKIYGSPWQPTFFDWAFNLNRGPDIRKKWEMIPKDSDIVITHGPVYKILDKTFKNEHVGCEDLREVIEEIKPKLHVCGHIHYSYGIQKEGKTTYVNASSLGEDYMYQNKPIVLTLEDLF